MPRPTFRTLAASALLTASSACGIVSSFHPHIPSSSDASGRTIGTSVGRPTAGGVEGDTRRTREPDEQQACRSAGAPRGWIAVAYVSAPEQCPARAGNDSTATKATVAILTHYAVRPVGSILEVCFDQNTPSGWVTESEDPAEDSGSCPGARKEGSTTKRIRRIR